MAMKFKRVSELTNTNGVQLNVEQITENRDALLEVIKDLCKQHQDHYFKRKVLTMEEKENLEKDLLKKEELLKSLQKTLVYKGFKSMDNPLLEACKRQVYGQYRLKKISDDKQNKTRFFYELSTTNVRIDLYSLADYVGGDQSWIDKARAFEVMLAASICDDLNIPMHRDTVSQQSKELILKWNKMKEEHAANPNNAPDPFSNGAMQKALDEVVQAILGEGYHCRNYDAKYLRQCYAGDDKKSLDGIKMTDKFQELLIKMLHLIVHKKAYVNSNLRKQEEAEAKKQAKKAAKELEKMQEQEKKAKEAAETLESIAKTHEGLQPEKPKTKGKRGKKTEPKPEA